MTEDIEALNAFKTSDIPEVCYETPYSKILRAASLLANDKALNVPRSFFKTKFYRQGLNVNARKLGVKIKAYEKDGIVYIWQVR